MPLRRPSDARRAELTLYRFLTRFCSRNDTTGTAGTTLYGTFHSSPSTLVGDPAAGKRKVVFASPRHAELLCHRAAYGLLRSRANLVLSPCYHWHDGDLYDPHEGARIPLSQEEKALVARLVTAPLIVGDLLAPEGLVADQLVSRNLLILRLGHPS